MAKLAPPPERALSRAWTRARRRLGLRHLDVGSGAGHWIDFGRDVLLASESIAVELTPTMASFLADKYAAHPAVRVFQSDVSAPDFTAEAIGGRVDLVSAIGVMFHIVDDAHWQRALSNLAGVMKAGALLFAGGEFGVSTRNVQFHGRDDFASWRDYDKAGTDGEVRVNKRVRSLAAWHRAAADAGLEVVDLVRSDREPGFTTPENDVLVLRRPAVTGQVA
jgi:SAM-dependent methyltransferase